MDTSLVREGLFAIGTAIAGILVFVCAPYVPSLFPQAVTRLVGFATVCFSCISLWMLSSSWQSPTLIGVSSLGIMILVHMFQTRQQQPDDPGNE